MHWICHRGYAKPLHLLRNPVAHSLTGFCNILIPTIIFSCSYLIIPFTRGSVILVEALPALAAKLIFPHLIHYVPYYQRLFLIILCWAVSGIVSWATPPNVETSLRVLVVMLATATAALTEVWMLGMLRHYGRSGVAGWGIGTGLGYLAAALYPYVVTVKIGIFLRDTLESLYLLVPALAWGLSLVLTTRSKYQYGEPCEEADSDHDEGASLFVEEPPRPGSAFRAGVEQNLNKLGGLVKPVMRPLYDALRTQALFLPGLFRAAPQTNSFDTFFAYFTACGLAFHIGNLIGRSSILYKRTNQHKQLIRGLTFFSLVLMLNSLFVIISSPIVLLGFTSLAGVVSGTVYIQTIDSALEITLRDSPDDSEVLMGAIGAAGTLGVLVGGLMGAVCETLLCGKGWGYGHRWCYSPR